VNESQYTFPPDMNLRFLCDAGDDTDDVYIDLVEVSAFTP